MSTVLGVLIIISVVAFASFNIFGLVKDIINRKKSKSVKSSTENTDSVEKK